MRLFVADTIPPYLLRMRRNIFLFYPRPRSLKPLVAISESSLSPELNLPISLPKLLPVRFRQRKVFLRFREGNISYTRRLIVSRFVDSCPRYRRTFTPICQLVIEMLANQTGFTKKAANVVTFLLLTFSFQSSGSFFLYSKVASQGRSGQRFPKKVKTYSLPPSVSLPEKYSAVPESLKAINFIETVQSSERQNSRSIDRVVEEVHVLACKWQTFSKVRSGMRGMRRKG